MEEFLTRKPLLTKIALLSLRLKRHWLIVPLAFTFLGSGMEIAASSANLLPPASQTTKKSEALFTLAHKSRFLKVDSVRDGETRGQ